jgi:hypothetical protein
MTNYSDEKHRRIEQFAEYLRLMGMRRHKIVKNDDCYILFEESAPGGVDAPHVEESTAARVEAECLANGGPASVENDAANPPPDWSPAKRLRYVQFAFSKDCFYLDLSNRTLLPHEAELILREGSDFYWARNRPDLPLVRKNWKDIVKWDPVQKVYLYGDEQPAAEDLAFIIFQVWKFPVDWPWCITAGAFHTDHRFECGKRIE